MFQLSDSFALPTGVTVTEIARSSGPSSYANYIWPAINESGAVCYKGADPTRSAILKGDGTQIQTIASSEGPLGIEQFPTGICSINDAGDVAFYGCQNCESSAITYKVYVFKSGIPVLVSQTGAGASDFKIVSIPTVNNSGDVSFNGVLNDGTQGVWIFSSGTLTNVIATGGMFSEIGAPFMNDSRAITFGATETASPSHKGLYTPAGNRLIGTFNGFSEESFPSMNNASRIAALATSSSVNGVYIDGIPYITSESGDFREVDISGFQGISINDAGEVVFPAIRPNGNPVAFLAVNGGMVPLVEKGDLLPGYSSKVSFVNTGRESINNQRQISLVVGLEDKTQLVLRLDAKNLILPNDQCPADNAKFEPGVCGCGISDLDSNSDQIPDCIVTSSVRQLSDSLYKKIKALKTLPRNASKKKKNAMKQITKEATRLSNQLYSLVKGSQAQVKISSSKKTPIRLATDIRNLVKKAIKTQDRNFSKNKKSALSSLKNFIKILKV